MFTFIVHFHRYRALQAAAETGCNIQSSSFMSRPVCRIATAGSVVAARSTSRYSSPHAALLRYIEGGQTEGELNGCYAHSGASGDRLRPPSVSAVRPGALAISVCLLARADRPIWLQRPRRQ